MAINDQLDENAADLRSLPQENQLPAANAPEVPAQISVTSRSVSKTEIILAVGIMVGLVLILAFLLQRKPSGSTMPPLVGQPLPAGFLSAGPK